MSETAPNPGTDAPVPNREWSAKLFLGFLGAISSLYAIVLIYHISTPPGTAEASDGLLEQCRQICLQYGLVSTGNVREDAEAYLDAVQTQRLTEGLAEVLSDSNSRVVESQSHPLRQRAAPEFALPDDSGTTQSLKELGRDRPLVVVFYLGYGCSHCVAQLLALEKDLHYFRELDADIVAISQDSSEHTSERYKEYGRFSFPVLSDADNNVAETWGVYEPETDELDENRDHGTFVVDRNGQVIWAVRGKEPFLDSKTLLHVIAASQGLLPAR